MLKRKIIKDFIYNVIATSLPTLVLQLMILPLIAQKMDGDEYGLVLTVVAAIMMLAAGVGNVINNVHLLSDKEYKEKNVSGDFGILLSFSLFVVSGVTIVFSCYVGTVDNLSYIWNLLFAGSTLIKEYYIVRFWIDLDYFGILKCNILCVVGYFLGLCVFWFGESWQLIYIVGNVFGIVYIIKNYKLTFGFFSKTAMFKKTAGKTLTLTISTVLARSMQYVDRLLLYPLLGGEEVSIYYVSTLIGKTISMALSPINSFLLSQLAKKNRLQKRIFWIFLGVLTLTGFVGYAVCMMLARPILGLLYPQWIGEAMQYVAITTWTAVVSAMAMVLAPIVLRFCNMNWQIVINAVCFCVYVFLSLVLFRKMGLMGFCIGSLLANVVSLILMIFIYQFTYKEGRK